MPRHRNVPFKTPVLDNYSRSEAALIASMAEMVVSGVATRKVSNIMETLCGTTFSKSSFSEVCKDLIEKVNEFKDRPLTGKYPFLTVAATYFKVRDKHRIVSEAFMIAYETNQKGHREILGFEVYDNESKDTWNSFLQKLKKRGIQGLLMLMKAFRMPSIRYFLMYHGKGASFILPGTFWENHPKSIRQASEPNFRKCGTAIP